MASVANLLGQGANLATVLSFGLAVGGVSLRWLRKNAHWRPSWRRSVGIAAAVALSGVFVSSSYLNSRYAANAAHSAATAARIAAVTARQHTEELQAIKGENSQLKSELTYFAVAAASGLAKGQQQLLMVCGARGAP